MSLKLYLELRLLTSWYLPSPADSSLTHSETNFSRSGVTRLSVFISSQWQTLESHAKKCWPGIYEMLSVGGWWISILLFDGYHSHSWRDLHLRTDTKLSQPPTSIRDCWVPSILEGWNAKYFIVMYVMWHGFVCVLCVGAESSRCIDPKTEWMTDRNRPYHPSIRPFLRSWFRLQPTKVANKLLPQKCEQ